MTDPRATAREVFARYLLGIQTGETIPFEAVCAKHASQADELRRLHARWKAMSRGFKTPRIEQTFLNQLESKYGEGADPGITLPFGEDARHVGEAAQRLRQLARQPKSQRYITLGEVARGGMGVVLYAWDTVLRRRVAMKLLSNPGQGSSAATPPDSHLVQRFLEEAQIAGQLDHPGVVAVHDLGLDANGQIYFTMPLIEGQDLHEIFDLAREEKDGWTLTRAVNVLLKVAETVGYAHARNVVHRDLKPANVMVGRFGETYVVDWGLACVVGETTGPTDRQALEPERRGLGKNHASRLTVDGEVLGTPAYMPPEQAKGQLERIDARADVYAMGAMLYHLLAGHMPYVPEGSNPPAKSIVQMVKKGRPPPLREVAPHAPLELIAISEKAMARKPKDRYPSMPDLADDLRAYLEGRVVQAYETGTFGIIKKLILRNKRLSAAVATAVLITITAMVTVTWIHTERNRELERSNQRLVMQKQRADELAREAREQERTTRHHSYLASLLSASSSLRIDDAIAARRRLADSPAEFRGWEYAHLLLSMDCSERTLVIPENLPATSSRLSCLAVTADGRRVVAGTAGGTIHLWEKGSLSVLHAQAESVQAIAMSPDGALLISSSGQRMDVWDLDRSIRVATLDQHDAEVRAIAFSPDGKQFASADDQGSIRLWNPQTLEAHTVLRGHTGAVHAARFTEDGKVLATGGQDRTIRIWTSGEESMVLPGHADAITDLAFSHDAQRIASASRDDTVRVWSTTDGSLIDVLRGHVRDVVAVDYLDPMRLISGSADGTAHVWDAPSGNLIAVLRGHVGPVCALRSLGDGKRILTAGADHTIKTWNPGARAPSTSLLRGTSGVRSGSFDATGMRVVVGGDNQIVTVVDSHSGRVLRLLIGHLATVTDATFWSDSVVLSASQDGTVRVWDLREIEPRAVLRDHSDAVLGLAVSTDRKLVASASADGTVRIWDPADWSCKRVLRGDGGAVHDVTFLEPTESAVAPRLATVSADGRVRIWPADGDAQERSFPAHIGAATCLVPCDDRRLATGGEDHLVRLWDLGTSVLSAVEFAGHEGTINHLLWTGSAARLVSAGEDGTVRVWDPELADYIFVDDASGDATTSVAFSPDDRRLLITSRAPGLRILESESLDGYGSPSARFKAADELARATLAAQPSVSLALQALSGFAELTSTQRDAAIQVVLVRADARELVRASWEIVCCKDRTSEEKIRARQWMGLAAPFGTSDAQTQRTLGAACLRVGELDEALDALQTTMGLDPSPVGRARTLALTALAHDLRGDRERALIASKELRQVTDDLEDLDDDSRRLVAEAIERLVTPERSTSIDGAEDDR